jgi:hypothetical protein
MLGWISSSKAFSVMKSPFSGTDLTDCLSRVEEGARRKVHPGTDALGLLLNVFN